jgi:helicase MOV-10
MPNCPNVLSRGICTDSTCRLEHKILICEPCGFIASNENAYTIHLQGQRHKSRIAGRSIALYCPVCEMNIEGGVWASHKAGSSHLKQATQKGLSADVEPQEGTDGQGQKYCEICKLVVDNSKWARHLRSVWHLKRKDFASYQAAISDAEKDKNGITARGNLDFGIIDVNKTKKTAGCAITLKAITANVRVKLTDVKLASSRANTEAASVSVTL